MRDDIYENICAANAKTYFENKYLMFLFVTLKVLFFILKNFLCNLGHFDLNTLQCGGSNITFLVQGCNSLVLNCNTYYFMKSHQGKCTTFVDFFFYDKEKNTIFYISKLF